jgi:hypothetical protein
MARPRAADDLWATRKIDIDEFPNVKRWLEEIGERPAVKKAMAMGPEFPRGQGYGQLRGAGPTQKASGRPAGAADPRRMASCCTKLAYRRRRALDARRAIGARTGRAPILG